MLLANQPDKRMVMVDESFYKLHENQKNPLIIFLLILNKNLLLCLN